MNRFSRKLFLTVFLFASRKTITPIFALATIALTLLVSNPILAVEGETMIVPVAGKVSWDNLVQKDREQATSVTPAPQAVPFMPMPKVPALPKLGSEVEYHAPADAVYTPGYSPASQIPPVTLSFVALADNGTSIPPDTDGAVGLNHVMTMLNSQVRIQDRAGAILSTVSLTAFWSPAGSSGIFDPRVLYDQSTNRWIATVDAARRSASSAVLFAISANADPTGSWTFYKFVADSTGTNWADFPDIGFNNTWIAITNNMFGVVGDAFANTAMWVIDKTSALAGGALTMTFFAPGFDVTVNPNGFGSTLRVCNTFGAQSTLYIIDNAGFTLGPAQLLRLSRITGTGASPTWTVVAGGPFPGSGFFTATNNFNTTQINAPQSGASGLIETNDSRLINAVYRNGHIWTTHSAGLPTTSANRTAVFWYQIDPTKMATGPIVQSGVIDGGAGVHLIYPSIAVNVNNDAFIGCSRSSSTRFVEAVYTGRLSTDPAGTMDPIKVLKAGEDSYIKDLGTGRIRWGDYSATMVDPVDDKGFWTIQEYAALDVGPSASNDRWGTIWGNAPTQSACCIGIVGNIDGDVAETVDITDLTVLIDHLFISLTPLQCKAEGNIDADVAGIVDITDLTALIDHLFINLIPLPSC